MAKAPKKAATSKKSVKKAATKTSVKKATTKKSVAKKAPAKKGATKVSGAQRDAMIAVAAYYIAEKRGFVAGDTTADWLQAEAQIDALIASGQLQL